ITSPPVARMYAGEVITYFIRPLLGIPLGWMTEITHVEEGRYFVDEQRKGPYALWHHQHHFAAAPGGVVMTDIVHYQLPWGFLGTLAGKLFVYRQLEDIFEYRRMAIEGLWGRPA
ncbi:MAG TPA: SRPBCC family protein, partial [Chitinophaga sp.]